MAIAAGKTKGQDSSESPLELIYREDKVNEYWDSRLFNRVYLKHDIQDKIAAWHDDQHFAEFQDKIKNILNSYKGKEHALETMSERNLQNSLIKDILCALNWANEEDGPIKPFIDDVSFTYNEKTYKPDIIILEHPDDNSKVEGAKAQDRLNYARQCAQMVVEVKYWNRIEKREQREKEDKTLVNKDRQDDLSGIVSPNDQTIRYMDLLKLNWGMLTDGTKWRLFNKDLSIEGSDRYYEFNFYKLFKAYNTAESEAEHNAVDKGLRYFFHFFAKQSFFPEDGAEPTVDTVLIESKKYADKIEEDLKKRFLEAMNLTCNAIHDSPALKLFIKKNNLNREETNSLIVNTSESILFNIMFIKSLETRRVLPMVATDYKKRSLTGTLWKIEKYNPENSEARNAKELERTFSKGNGNSFKYTSDGFDLHDRMTQLIDAIHKGAKKDDFGFEISGFKETIFNDRELEIFTNCKISNKDWVAMLFMLGYTQSETDGFRKYQQIPYEFFTPRQLGSIYESFLEFKLDKADDDLIFMKGKWQAANLESERVRQMDVPKVKKGHLFFTPNNDERKATGSYYTPDEVVKLIVDETLKPLVANRSSSEILKLRVVDTAMGSGHFLAGALTYLAKRYLEALKKETFDDVRLSEQEAKQEVLHNCIFGVDINSRAVKLAKMSLWLESASFNKKLEDLDGQLKATNSLTDHNLWKKEWGFLEDGIDAVIGNPPYLGEKGHKEIFQKIAGEWLGQRFYQGKMDLFYFFFHLGLDILKDGGRLGFITTNYFTTALGAKTLRRDFYERTHIDLLINLNELKVFGEAAGQHNMITILTKTNGGKETRIINSNESGKCNSNILNEICYGSNKKTIHSTISKPELFDSEERYIRINKVANSSESKSKSIDSALSKMKNKTALLGDIFCINTGIQTGADKVGKKHLEKDKTLNSKKGDGIFVLNASECKRLNLSKLDSEQYLKPFFKNSDVQSFKTISSDPEFVIYTDRSCKVIPENIEKHLLRFKSILTQRREVKNKVIDWFQLQWPRDKSIFTGEKIVAPQRSRLNKFGYNIVPWYASCDVYFITANENHDVSLKYALGLLNSKLYFCWLYVMGKRKGESLELYQTPLSEVPLKIAEEKVQQKIIRLVSEITHEYSTRKWNLLNQLVYELFDLNKAEIDAVEKMYDSRLKANDASDLSEDQSSEEVA